MIHHGETASTSSSTKATETITVTKEKECEDAFVGEAAVNVSLQVDSQQDDHMSAEEEHAEEPLVADCQSCAILKSKVLALQKVCWRLRQKLPQKGQVQPAGTDSEPEERSSDQPSSQPQSSDTSQPMETDHEPSSPLQPEDTDEDDENGDSSDDADGSKTIKYVKC